MPPWALVVSAALVTWTIASLSFALGRLQRRRRPEAPLPCCACGRPATHWLVATLPAAHASVRLFGPACDGCLLALGMRGGDVQVTLGSSAIAPVAR